MAEGVKAQYEVFEQHHIILLYICACRESVGGHYVPNAGFLEDVVIADPEISSASQISDASEGASGDQHEDLINEVEESDVGSDTRGQTEIDAPKDVARNEVSEELTSDLSGLKVSEHISAEEPSLEKEQQVLSNEEIDILLEKCLLQALHTTVKDKDLPMPGSTLW